MNSHCIAAILAITAISFSPGAAAKWSKVNENSEFSTYANRASIHKNGHIVKMISMYDYKTAQTNLTDSFLYMSTQQQGEYDCKEEKSRMLASSLYSRNMNNGRVIHYKSRSIGWITVSHEGTDETLWKIACAKSQTHQLR